MSGELTPRLIHLRLEMEGLSGIFGARCLESKVRREEVKEM